MMHGTFMKTVTPEHPNGDKSFPIKQKALAEVGILVDKSSDGTAKRWDNSWQLACHTGEIWTLLSKVFKLTLEGKLKGMSANAKKYVDPSFRESTDASNAAPAAAGGKSKKGRSGPKSARPPMPRSKALQDLKDQKVEVPDIKQDVWKRFIGVESKEGGSQFYIELLQKVVNLQLSMADAGNHAVDFKRQATAQADMVALLADQDVKDWAQAERVYPKHCTRERLAPILRAYITHKPQKGEARSKYPQEIMDLVDEARSWKAGSDRTETESDTVWKKDENTGAYQFVRNDEVPSQAHFKVITEDIHKLASSRAVPKMAYRFVMGEYYFILFYFILFFICNVRCVVRAPRDVWDEQPRGHDCRGFWSNPGRHAGHQHQQADHHRRFCLALPKGTRLQ